MLKKLYIENYALIDRLEIELDEGLNIITGETGAGKTILLGALGMLLGNRADSALVKDMERNCVVEGEFEIGRYDLEDFFSEHDLDYDPATIVRRVVMPGGKTRCYINDLPVQVTMLREFGSKLIDIHSQHQNLVLAEESFRVGVLDSVAANEALLDEYGKAYDDLRRVEKQLQKLRDEAQRSSSDQQWLEFQVLQFDEARLSDGELEELESRQMELSHAQDIQSALGGASELLSDDDAGVLTRLKAAEKELANVVGYYPRADEFLERMRSSLVELKDMEAELSSEAQRVESDPIELERVAARLDAIYGLLQKHKAASVGELIELHKKYKERLDAITGCDEAIAELEKRIEQNIVCASRLAGKLTESRMKAAAEVSKHVEKTLALLGMPSSVFTVEIAPAPSLGKNGMDDVFFLFSSHKGVAQAPVEKIASGGEISRVMLSVKSLMAKTSHLPSIVFDEIDTGVSGRIADAMGVIIEELAQSMQVINITHLPQVASKGDAHFLVFKDTTGDKAITSMRRLTREERVGEIAKMLSGTDITDAAMQQARLLLGEK